MARSVWVGSVFAGMLAFGCGDSGGADGGMDAGVDAGGVLQDLSDANEALVDGLCDCVELGVGSAGCALIIDLYGDLAADAGIPDLSAIAAFRKMSAAEQACVEALIEEDSTEVESFFDCQAGAATAGAGCYEELASVAFGGECNEEDFLACSDSVTSDLGQCEPVPAPLAACVAGTPADFVDGLIKLFDEQCECDDDPPACREMQAPLTEKRTCLIDEIQAVLDDTEAEVPPGTLDCLVGWLDRAGLCYGLVQECGQNRDFCGSVGSASFSGCPDAMPLLQTAFTECEVSL